MTQFSLDLFGRSTDVVTVTLEAPLVVEREIIREATTVESQTPPEEIDEKRPQLSLFEIEESWRELWKGMPEFIQRDLTPLKTIYVHFESREDMAAFAVLIDQTITMQTRAVWYPEADIASITDRRYIDGPAPDDDTPDGVEIDELPES